jgi:hypothetical protein
MAHEANLVNITLPASGDLSTKQYYIVAVNSSGQAAVCGDGAMAAGVLQNKPSAAGRSSTVAVSGITKVIAAGIIAPGAKIASDNAGKATTATTGEYVIGIALNTANTAASDVFPILLLPQGPTA